MAVELYSNDANESAVLEAASDALRGTFVDPKKISYYGFAPINQRSTTSFSAYIWSIVNMSVYHTIYVTKVQLRGFFDDVGATTTVLYELDRVWPIGSSSATGTPPGPGMNKYSSKTSEAAHINIGAPGHNLIALGQGVAISTLNQLATMRVGRAPQTTTKYVETVFNWDFSDAKCKPIELICGHALGIFANSSILGDSLYGFIEWIEVEN